VTKRLGNRIREEEMNTYRKRSQIFEFSSKERQTPIDGEVRIIEKIFQRLDHRS